jgi:general secretion pathway protein E
MQVISSETDSERLRDLASEAPVIRLLTRIMTNAVDLGASDIHFEPMDQGMQVRYRLDGILSTVENLELKTALAVTSRIKVLSKLNIAEKRIPQDGKMRIPVHGRQVDFRVATSPLVSGEAVVVRVLDRSKVDLDFDKLGFSHSAQNALTATIKNKNGIFLVTGPTGSGKTTTLYTALKILNRPENKVFTVEDPVEVQMKGVNQFPVRPEIGLDFAAVLRSVLRQDPDIIMIGEIRDPETARIAVQASLTGHLVLSTVHTNSAAGAITRLRNLGMEDYLLASTVRAVLAQRLVRKTCTVCKAQSGNSDCLACKGTGYKGRTVVYEFLPITTEVQTAISNGQNETEIEVLARQRGMIPMAELGESLVRSGKTTAQELQRLVADV